MSPTHIREKPRSGETPIYDCPSFLHELVRFSVDYMIHLSPVYPWGIGLPGTILVLATIFTTLSHKDV